MNNMVAGIGDVLMRYPALIEDLTDAERARLDAITPGYVAVHLGSSDPQKIPPNPKLLIHALQRSGARYMLVGHDSEGPAPKLRMHIEIVKRARKFIGTLSCFNVVAQLAKVPSFVLVNRAHTEPFIYGLMAENRAVVEAWNLGCRPVGQIYDQAVEWAVRP